MFDIYRTQIITKFLHRRCVSSKIARGRRGATFFARPVYVFACKGEDQWWPLI